MNTAKTVVVTLIMMAVCYGVYVSLWQKPEQTASDKSSDSSAAPAVQFPGQHAMDSRDPRVALGGGTNSSSSTPGSLGSSSPLFPSNAAGGNSTIRPVTPHAGGSNNVTLIPPAPGTDKVPSTPSMLPPGISPSGAGNPGQGNPAGDALTQDEFDVQYRGVIQQIEKMLDDGKLPEALMALTKIYEFQKLPEMQRREIEQLLDQLAGTVIYSPQSYLERPYVVRQGETLDLIAESYKVPALLLARINGIDPQQLQAGQQIKVLRGPFTACVSLDKHELMLKLQGGYYAGRFPIGVGTDVPKLEGSYTVLNKSTITAGDGRNPLGKYWIDLGNRIGFHGTIDESGIGRDDNRGVISLKDRDIDDLFGILTVGSQVVIRR